MAWRSVAFRWFVQYNPLFFTSALCILGGVFLIAHEHPADDLSSKLGIAASTEAYQVLLILGAWLLLRANQRRPAAILGLTALVFLLDVPLNGERLFSHARTMSFAPGMRARVAVPASAMFALLGILKLWALARVFRLRQARGLVVPTGIALFAVPMLPYVIELAGPLDEARRAAHLSVFWLGAPLFGWAFTAAARRWRSDWAPVEGDSPRLARIVRAVPLVVAAGFVLHGTAWSTFPALEMSPAHYAPYVLVATCLASARLAKRGSRGAEPLAWVGTAAALVGTLILPPVEGRWPTAAIALMAGASLLALTVHARLRLLLPAIVCAFAGAYAFAAGQRAPLPVPGPFWVGALALALLAAAAAHRDFRCLFASAVASAAAVTVIDLHADLVPLGILAGGFWLAGWSWLLFPAFRRWLSWAAVAGLVPLAVSHRGRLMPQTSGGWGIALVVAGFVLLSAGIAFNLWFARRTRLEGE